MRSSGKDGAGGTRRIAITSLDAVGGTGPGYAWTRPVTGSYVFTFYGVSRIASAVASTGNLSVVAATLISGNQVTVNTTLSSTAAGINADLRLIVEVS